MGRTGGFFFSHSLVGGRRSSDRFLGLISLCHVPASLMFIWCGVVYHSGASVYSRGKIAQTAMKGFGFGSC